MPATSSSGKPDRLQTGREPAPAGVELLEPPAAGQPPAGQAWCCAPVTEVPLGELEAASLARLFGALADPVRLRLLSLVASRGEVCSCELEAPLGRSQPTISHHTKLLAEVGLVMGERRGRWTWWRVNPERLEALRAALGR